MHQGKLNLCHPISLSSRYRTSALTIVGVTTEVPGEVDSLRILNSLMYYSKMIGEDLSRSFTVTNFRCLRNFLV